MSVRTPVTVWTCVKLALVIWAVSVVILLLGAVLMHQDVSQFIYGSAMFAVGNAFGRYYGSRG